MPALLEEHDEHAAKLIVQVLGQPFGTDANHSHHLNDASELGAYQSGALELLEASASRLDPVAQHMHRTLLHSVIRIMSRGPEHRSAKGNALMLSTAIEIYTKANELHRESQRFEEIQH